MRTVGGLTRCAVSILVSATAVVLAAEPFVTDNPSATAPRLAGDNAQWRLELTGFDGGRALSVRAECADGTWTPASAALTGSKAPKVDAAMTRMSVTDTRVAGELSVTLAATNAMVELTGTVAFPDPAAWWPTLDYDPFGDGSGWWRVMAESQPMTASFSGTWKTGGRSGTVTGSLTPRRESGRFDMGVAGPKGLELRFDMGRKRVNWNHARVAVYTFPKPLDLRPFAGLRVTVTASEPRRDVEVSVWLREADGSWYYAKAAIPLVAENAEAFVDFRDMVEAEWVAPGSHIDEDYEFDRAAVSHFGVGLVNPLGIGRVSFILRGAKVEGTRPPTPSATASVTGRMLSVNGEQFVPPGLFGGYAPDLPQKYRPGCQRNLRYAPGGGPSIPDANHARFSPVTFLDWKAVARSVQQAQGEDPVAGIRALADEKELKGIAAAVEKDDAKAGCQYLERILNAALTNEQWAATTLDKANVPREVRDVLRDEHASGLAKMVALRRLIEFLFPGQFQAYKRATEAFNIDCMGDRFWPATRVTSREWKEQIAGLGRTYAAKARRLGCDAVMEWWNEPYLDWARGAGGKNYSTNFYDQAKAEDGGPVTINATGEVFDLLRWKKTPTGWRVYDPSQFGYFSGKANGRIYDDMIAVLGPAVKGTSLEHCGVTLVGGWGFRWHEDHWAAWDLLYRPTIDRGIEWLDGICEHHYQGDTTAMTGSYEVLLAYSTTRHNKRLRIYNTECNDLLDAPSRGMVDTPEKAKAATNYRRMTYNLRDILHMIRQVPDKAASRTVIHSDATPEGTDAAYGLMVDLRGRIVETGSDDPDLWCVSSVDGTDPRAVREDGQRRLVTILFNDHREPATVNLRIVPPAGTTLQSGTIEEITVDPASWKVGRKIAPAVVVTNTFAADLVLPARRAWKVAFPLTGELPPASQVLRHQVFSPDILREVTPGRPFETTVIIEPDKAKEAKRAWLRLVVEDVAPGEGWVEVAGTRIELPASRTADNCNRILELPLPSVPPVGKIPLRFVVAEGPHAGFRVDMVSVVLEEERR